MHMRKPIAGLVILSAFILCSCGGRVKNNSISEGVITYDITYDSAIQSRYDAWLLPSELIVRFNSNHSINSIEALGGAISISIIKNPERNEFSTLLKIFNKKLYHSEPIEQERYPALYSRMPAVKLISEGETCEFLGYSCTKAKGYFADNPDFPFEIIYTSQIQIENPNAHTPFEEVKGTLLQFNIRLNNLIMHATARSVKSEHVPLELFAPPSDYVVTDSQTIANLIYTLQQ